VAPGRLKEAPMPTTNDLKNGMTLNIDGDLMSVVEFQHVKPGKGGAFVRTKLKNVKTGRVLDKTFRADEPVDVAILEKRGMQYLYRDETGFHFMDTETYDQVVIEPDAVGDAARYMVEGSTPYVTFYQGRALGVELPAAVELEVRETEPGLKGDRVSGATKPATVETGAVVQVPLFVEVGDRVKVDTRSGAYLTRVQ
jgi:elongation factor P